MILMNAMRRLNRTSAVICLLLACAPRAYAQDIEHGEALVASAPESKLAGVYQHGQGGSQVSAKGLAAYHQAASQGDVEAQYTLPESMRTKTAYPSTTARPIVGIDWLPPMGILVRRAGWGYCSNLEKAWRKVGCRRICGIALQF